MRRGAARRGETAQGRLGTSLGVDNVVAMGKQSVANKKQLPGPLCAMVELFYEANIDHEGFGSSVYMTSLASQTLLFPDRFQYSARGKEATCLLSPCGPWRDPCWGRVEGLAR